MDCCPKAAAKLDKNERMNKILLHKTVLFVQISFVWCFYMASRQSSLLGSSPLTFR